MCDLLSGLKLGLRRNVVNGRRKLGEDHEGVKKVSFFFTSEFVFAFLIGNTLEAKICEEKGR